MDRKVFIQSLLQLSALATLSSFKNFSDTLQETETLMPVLFIGHGSPMNAIENNEFSLGWKNIIKNIPQPSVILCISAHWETNGTFVTAMEKPKTIHDFGGFAKALFDVQYNANGSVDLANEIKTIVTTNTVQLNTDWGLDHGCWSVLNQMYPMANIPVVQLSLDYTKDANYHYNLAKELYALRKKGVLILGSGNMVHNFSYANFNGNFNVHNGLDWALEANENFKKLLMLNDYQALINYEKQSKAFQLAIPTPEHYLPMIYSIALRNKKDNLLFFNDAVIGGSFSMTSFLLH